MTTFHTSTNILKKRTRGFTLIEVVLAIGVFLISILALVGLLGPTLTSVTEVTRVDETVSVVNTVNSFLMNSPDIAPNGSRFNEIYSALQTNETLTLFVFRRFIDGGSTDEELVVGFREGEVATAEDDAVVPDGAFTDSGAQISGPIFRVILSASSVTPEEHRSGSGGGIPGYTLSKPLEPDGDSAGYPEGYLAMEVNIFAESVSSFNLDAGLAVLNQRRPVFTYNMAIVR